MYLALQVGCGPLATQLPDLPVGLDRRVGAGIGSSACPAADAGGRSPIEAASHSRYRPDVLGTCVCIAKVRFRPEPGSRRFFGLRAELGLAPVSFTWQIPSHKGT